MNEADGEGKRFHWGLGNSYVVEGGKALILINGGAAIGNADVPVLLHCRVEIRQ
jgi:hypothetical protein